MVLLVDWDPEGEVMLLIPPASLCLRAAASLRRLSSAARISARVGCLATEEADDAPVGLFAPAVAAVRLAPLADDEAPVAPALEAEESPSTLSAMGAADLV